MLRQIRLTRAAVMFMCTSLFFRDFTGTMHHYVSWMPKLQFLEAVLAINVAVIIGLVVLTLVFGRIYCSVICPLGIMQDIYSWLGGKVKNNRFSYVKEHKWLRYSVLVIFIVCLIIGFAPVTTLLAPYGTYGRIVTSFYLNNIAVSIIAWVVMMD